jgi:hypothetical protein
VLNAPLPQPFVIVLTDEWPPLAQQTANWQVTSGSGTLASASTSTNGIGQAQNTFTLGATATAALITASVLGTSLTNGQQRDAGGHARACLVRGHGQHRRSDGDGAKDQSWHSAELAPPWGKRDQHHRSIFELRWQADPGRGSCQSGVHFGCRISKAAD